MKISIKERQQSSATSVLSVARQKTETIRSSKLPLQPAPSTATATLMKQSDKGKALLQVSNIYQDYLVGIDSLRKKLADMDVELSRIESEFYSPPSHPPSPKKASNSVFLTQAQSVSPRGDLQTDQRYNEYLRSVQDSLADACGSRDESLDSEQKLVNLISRCKQSPNTNTKGNAKQDTLTVKLVQFWESLNSTVEQLKQMHERFQRGIFSKMKANCLSFANTFGTRNAAAERYTQEILAFLERIDSDSDQLRLLAASYGTQVRTQLFSPTNIRIEQLVRGCDVKRFPIIRLFPELSDRFERLLRVATEWLTRDETFLFDLNRDIREGRSRTLEIQVSIQEGREKQRELAKALKTAYLMVRNSNIRLSALESELRELQAHATQCRNDKQHKVLEIHRKEGMKEFLEAGLANKSRARFALQYKQMRLLKQLSELEQVLSALEMELDRIERLILSKSTEVASFEKRHGDAIREYEACRKQFDAFSERSVSLQEQLSSLHEELAKMEAIRNFKTCPDVIENFYDRPASIKLSQSLQRRLVQRKPIVLTPIAPKQ